MSDAVALRTIPRSLRREALLLAIPLGLALLGYLVRYLAYGAVIPEASVAQYPMAMCRWDCGWYVRIVEQGYDSFPTPKMINAGNWAFFPLYPMMVAGLRAVTGLQTIYAAALLSLVLCVGAARVAWPLLGRDLKAYTLFAAFLVSGPFSIWFTTFYTEVLFLFLAVCVFAALQRRAFLWAAVFAALLSATRIVGVLIVFAIAIEMWRQHRETGGTWKNFIPAVLLQPKWLLAIFVAPLGLFGYMLFLHLQIGDAIAFSHVQRAWSRPTGLPPFFLWNALTTFPREGFWPSVPQQLALATLVGYALCVVLIVRKQYGMAVYSLMCLTAPLFAGMASMLRFTAGLAPMPLMLTQLLAARPWLFWLSLAALVGAGYFATIGWMTGYLTLV